MHRRHIDTLKEVPASYISTFQRTVARSAVKGRDKDLHSRSSGVDRLAWARPPFEQQICFVVRNILRFKSQTWRSDFLLIRKFEIEMH